MPAFLAKLAGVIGDTPWFLLVIAGGVLALAGGIGQVPQYGLVISDEYVRWTFVVLGSVVFIAGALVGVAEYILPGYERNSAPQPEPEEIWHADSFSEGRHHSVPSEVRHRSNPEEASRERSSNYGSSVLNTQKAIRFTGLKLLQNSSTSERSGMR